MNRRSYRSPRQKIRERAPVAAAAANARIRPHAAWPHARKASGFTLAELLVVIGIIAALIGILLTVLNKVRQQANTIKCQSNIRTILQAMFLYANANRGTLPIPVPYQEPSIYAAVRLINGTFRYDYTTGTLLPYIGSSPQVREAVFTCPSDGPDRFGAVRDPTSMSPPLDPTQPRNFSYTFNSHLMGQTNDRGALWTGVKLSQIVHADLKLLVLEPERPASPCDEPVVIFGAVPSRPDIVTLTRRHQGRANVGFADGHVEGIDGRATFSASTNTYIGKITLAKYVNLTSDAPGANP